MMFVARQIQEKHREQNRSMFMVFTDLTKGFDSNSREGHWQILAKAECLSGVVSTNRSLHCGIMAHVSVNGSIPDVFLVKNATKQTFVMARYCFGIVFSVMPSRTAPKACYNNI